MLFFRASNASIYGKPTFFYTPLYTHRESLLKGFSFDSIEASKGTTCSMTRQSVSFWNTLFHASIFCPKNSTFGRTCIVPTYVGNSNFWTQFNRRFWIQKCQKKYRHSTFFNAFKSSILCQNLDFWHENSVIWYFLFFLTFQFWRKNSKMSKSKVL